MNDTFLFTEKKNSLRKQRSRHLSDPQSVPTSRDEIRDSYDPDSMSLTSEKTCRIGSVHRAASNSNLAAIVDEVISAKKTCLHITREQLDKYNLRLDSIKS